MTFTKVVYFDEESVSDLLDMSAGGKEVSSTEHIKERNKKVEGDVSSRLEAKFSWVPFFGVSAGTSTAASASSVGRNIFNKTLSNTILTDYLSKFDAQELEGVITLETLQLSAPKESAAFMKMYTPYMAMLKTDDLPVNFSLLDEALQAAKGYYELVGVDPRGNKCILRFNISAFRNRYGLVDVSRMALLFHGVKVGTATEDSLTMRAEMAPSPETMPSAEEVLYGEKTHRNTLLDVYDVLLAGVHID